MFEFHHETPHRDAGVHVMESQSHFLLKRTFPACHCANDMSHANPRPIYDSPFASAGMKSKPSTESWAYFCSWLTSRAVKPVWNSSFVHFADALESAQPATVTLSLAFIFLWRLQSLWVAWSCVCLCLPPLSAKAWRLASKGTFSVICGDKIGLQNLIQI